MMMYVLIGVMFIGFIALNMWTKKNTEKQRVEKERMMNEQLVPGVWVHTRVGFFGRFVDLDGDVLILETPGGVETYWDKRMLASVGDLPFAAGDAEITEGDFPLDEHSEDLNDDFEEDFNNDTTTDTSPSDDGSGAEGK